MKLFLKIFAGVLILVECFLFLGGFRLLDFRSSFYGAGAVLAFLLSCPVYAIWRLSDQIDELQKRLKALEEQHKEQAE